MTEITTENYHKYLSYLAALGVPANSMQVVSYGKERPAMIGSNDAAWRQNRRAVVFIV